MAVLLASKKRILHSSQNEQDNRNYAKFAKIVMLEPANSQEAVDFMKYAYIGRLFFAVKLGGG